MGLLRKKRKELQAKQIEDGLVYVEELKKHVTRQEANAYYEENNKIGFDLKEEIPKE